MSDPSLAKRLRGLLNDEPLMVHDAEPVVGIEPSRSGIGRVIVACEQGLIVWIQEPLDRACTTVFAEDPIGVLIKLVPIGIWRGWVFCDVLRPGVHREGIRFRRHPRIDMRV